MQRMSEIMDARYQKLRVFFVDLDDVSMVVGIIMALNLFFFH